MSEADRVHSGRGLWKRAVAGALALAMALGLVNFTLPTTNAAEDTSYADELKVRQDEYKEKFDLTKLLWSNETRAGATTPYGNSARNYLYWAEGNFGGVAYKNYIHVFAFEGDTICFGSDVYNSRLNIAGNQNATGADKEEIESKLGKDATADIVLIDLDGNRIPYDVKENGKGHIPNVQTEVLAKTMESPDGNDAKKLEAAFPGLDVGSGGELDEYSYTPLTYTVKETGVYTIEFHSYAYTSNVGAARYGQTTKNDDKDTTVNAGGTSEKNTKYNFYKPEKENNKDVLKSETDDTAHSALVAAWDVSVFNEQGQKETGRVYADYLSMQQNGGYDVVETYYVVTTDSYIYRWDWNGNRPNTYNFFADNKGLTDNATGSTLYKSVKELQNSGFDYTRFGASFKYPGSANTDESKSYYIFFEMPNPDLEGHLYSKAIQPDPAENIRFVDTVEDKTGHTVPGAYEGMGGYFAFDTKEATTATLTLDFRQLKDKDGNPVKDRETYAPVTISGPVKPYSTNYFYWDGRDGNGVVIPVGEYQIKDIITLTTKAGEIHFPVHDMEYAPGGFTFTRVSPIYDREGNVVSGAGTILDATKSVIYYDDTAIYYGEKVGRTGLTEEGVRPEGGGESLRVKYEDHVIEDNAGSGQKYFKFNNMRETDGGEYAVRNACKDYVGGVTAKGDGVTGDVENFIRIGDHSHTTNTIEYYGTGGKFLNTSEPAYESQKDKIEYLDSSEYPVAKVHTSATYGDTTDYGISDFWTFVPAQPAVIKETNQVIEIIDGDAFNLTGQVFYDNGPNPNGSYDSMADSDTLLSGVTLNLYKKTTDEHPTGNKTYYILEKESNAANGKDEDTLPRSVMKKYTGNDFSGKEVYELYRTAETPVSGRYFFTNIPYEETGETFVYEVVRPGVSYVLTSGTKHPAIHHSATQNNVTPGDNGSYALYAYDENGLGTEVQVITVGNDTGQVNPDSKPDPDDPNHTVTAVDVGYHYDLTTKFKLKKVWSAGTGTAIPEPAVFEVCYVDKNGTSHIYEEEPVTRIQNLEHTYELLPAEMDGAPVKDWYVAAEYYFANVDGQTYLFRHTFEYDPDTGDYTSFVGDYQYVTATDIDKNEEFDERDLPDGNDDGKSDWLDLQYIKESDWQSAEGVPGVSAPFHAVLDRNIGSAETTVTITNSDKPGVIEILKYTGSETDHNYLSGATFRLYADTDGGDDDITLDKIKEMVDGEETAELAKMQVDSGSTRDNGRMTFSGLDPNKHYVIREVYPPAGYRAREVLYIVHPATCKDPSKADHYHATQDGMTDDEWDTWQLQNLYFGEDDRALANIANIPSSGDMAIRKQIEGRAWGVSDFFTFDVAFRTDAGELISTADGVTLTQTGSNYVISGSSAVRIPQTEYLLHTDTVTFNAEMKNFLSAFNTDTKDLTVNYNSESAQDTISVHGMQDVKVSLPDTKQSVALIVNDEILYDEDGNPITKDPSDAQLNTSNGTETGPQALSAHTFPAAGTYTFTVSENPGDQPTTDYTSRVYTVVVQVTRVLDPGVESVDANLENSYLRAEVQAMYYQDVREGEESTGYPENYSGRAYYAGVAPTFTNRYHIQPAVQSTSYAVQVDFSGRLDDNGNPINKGNITENWLTSDQFTVTITGDDETTQKALEEGNIYIGGLLGDREKSPAEKKIDFNQTDVTNPNNNDIITDTVVNPNEHIFRFEELDFKNIEFPVKWEFADEATVDGQKYAAGTEVPEEDTVNGKNLVIELTAEEAESLNLQAGYYLLEDASYREQLESHKTALHKVNSRTEDLVYHLTIRMKNGEKDGITYDTDVYKMTITLKNSSDGSASVDGIIDEMDLVVTKKNAAGSTVEDKYATCETDQHTVNKFSDWTNPEGYFSLLPGQSAPEPGATVKYSMYYVNADGVIREVEVETATDGTKHYYVSVAAAGGGQTRFEIMESNFDDLIRNNGVTFIVKKEVHSGNHTMVFNNVYKTTGTWTPKVTKKLEGRDWQNGEAFEFTLDCTTWPGDGVTYKPEIPKNITVNKDQSETGVPFSAVTFKCPGVYTFTVTESGTGEGLGGGNRTPDIILTVTADDDDNGHLNLTVEGDGGTTSPGGERSNVSTTVNFVNTYIDGGEFTLAVAKTLTGKDWGSDGFEFTIEAKKQSGSGWIDIPSDDPLKLPSSFSPFTVSASDSGTGETRTRTLGTVTVGNLRGNPATYRFTVTEKTDDFDSRNLYCAQPKIYLTVTVTPNRADGTDTITATYAYLDTGESVGSLTEPLTLPFTNRYYATAAPGATDSSLTVGKTLTGRDWQVGESYDVNVELTSDNAAEVQYNEGTGAYTNWGEALKHTFTSTSGGSTDPSDWTLNFRFFAAGDYVFTVTEQEPASKMAGIICDAAAYTVTFHVTANEYDENKLVVTRTISDGSATVGSIVFRNVYTPTPATWTPSVTKQLEGRDWVANDSFTFTLARTDGTGDGVTMPEKTTVTVTNAADHKASFGEVTFTKVGTYTFTITETAPGNGITVTPDVYEFTAAVTDNPKTGQLLVQITPEGTPVGPSAAVETETTFVNNYSLTASKFTLAIQKTLLGREWTEGESFSFTITPDKRTKAAIDEGNLTINGDAWGSPAADTGAYTVTVTNPGGGETVTKTLEAVTVNKPGTYIFTIAENPSDDTYCPEPEIVLTVNAMSATENGVPTGDLRVVTSRAYSGGGSLGGSESGAATVSFTNYAYAEADFTLRKNLNGRNWGADEVFHAEVELIKAELPEGVSKVGQVVCAGSGEHLSEGSAITLAMKEEEDAAAQFRFLAAGTYTFEVTEVHGRLSGVTYDSRVYTVTVTVTADPATGALTAALPVITEEGVHAESIVFVNEYDPVPITGGLTVRKAVVGDDPDKAGPFRFTVTLDDASVTGNFGGMTFEGGVATFALSDGQVITAAGLPAGVSYKVTEESDPDYTAEATGDTGVIPEEGTAQAHFTNIQNGFEPPEEEDEGGLTISTYVLGIGDKKKEWHFSVKLTEKTMTMELDPDHDKEYVSISFHEDSGDIKRETIVFTDGETKIMLEHGWHMTILGLPPEAEYEVHEIEAGQDGYTTRTLHTSGTIPHHAIADAVIVNDLEPEDIPTGTLTVSKTVAGNAGETDREFNFTVTLTDMTGYNVAPFIGGVATFKLKHGEHRTFTGLPAGTEYTVTEDDVSGEGYTTISTNTTGTIQANTISSASFTNIKNSSAEPTPGNGFLTVTKTVTGNAGEHNKEFTFTVTLSEPVAGGPFNGKNTATFPLKDGESVTFELPDGTSYTVTESAESAAGYTTTSSGTSGVIRVGQTSVASFVNDRTIPTGSLTVAKTVTGAQGDKNREWSFRVELSRPLTGHFGDMDFDKGVAVFTLTHGGRKTATDLPAEIGYTVRETDANTGNYTTSSEGASGFIPAGDTVAASFVNEWRPTPPPRTRYGGLTVSKTVAGGGGDTQRVWHFRVELDRTLSGVYGGMSFTAGVAEFTLKHGESVTALDLPTGVAYTVTEAEAGTEGYTTSATGASGTIPDGGTAQAAFTNARDEATPDDPPDTTPPDTSPDVPPDTSPDVPPDTSPDTPPDTSPDVPPDTRLEDPPDDPPGTLPAEPTDDPSDESPGTGDDGRFGLWLTLMVLSLTGIAAMFIPAFRRRKLVSLRGRHIKR